MILLVIDARMEAACALAPPKRRPPNMPAPVAAAMPRRTLRRERRVEMMSWMAGEEVGRG